MLPAPKTRWVGVTCSILGVGCIVAGVWMYVQSIVHENVHNWEPLTLPVSLDQRTIRTPEIHTDRDGKYDVVLDLDQKFDMRRMECLLGLGSTNPQYCGQVPNLIDISWKLLEGEKSTADGDSKDDPSSLVWGSTVQRQIGSFMAQQGHRYTLVLDIKRDASELNIANPRIKVEVDRGISKDYAAGTAIEKVEALVLGLVGAIIIIIIFLTTLIKRRVVSPSPLPK